MLRPLPAVAAALPRLRVLDLCCGAGGVSVGFHRAGFDVTGVDINPQPNYPTGPGFRFVQADALDYVADHGHTFDLVHGSWPCQRFSRATAWRGNRDNHPDLITPGRALMQATGRPWVIENVPGAPLRPDYLLCGTAFGLNIQRHRVFETSWGGGGDLLSPCWHHRQVLPFEHKGERAYADAMGCTWMTNLEARQAVPPAYSHWIATQYLTHHHSAGPGQAAA
ncbi:DNA cytosine methyltransferase [Kitasatospora sp. NBC_00070]|uniref:DNA cytosine methyltransferase n=1 Tax=Kitasatospora sp. NBC_00070 TaxID=2975962 RepID=UPI0032544DAF